MEEPLVRIMRQDVRERGGGRDARRAELYLGGLRRRTARARLGAKLVGDKVGDALAFRLVQAIALMPPAVELRVSAPSISLRLVRQVGVYGTPSTAGRLNPIAIHARSNCSMNFPERPG